MSLLEWTSPVRSNLDTESRRALKKDTVPKLRTSYAFVSHKLRKNTAHNKIWAIKSRFLSVG